MIDKNKSQRIKFIHNTKGSQAWYIPPKGILESWLSRIISTVLLIAHLQVESILVFVLVHIYPLEWHP